MRLCVCNAGRMDYALFPDLLDKLAKIEALGRSALTPASENVAELKRQAAAAGKRRARDEKRYQLGGLLLTIGFENIDYYALYGLMAHPDHLLKWSIEARQSSATQDLARLIEHIFDDDRRAERCAEWGRYLSWTRMRTLYEAEVTSFIASGKAGAKQRWRCDPVSSKQLYLIAQICKLEGIANPNIAKKGCAFDWLYERDGNPRYFKRPAPLPLELS